MEIALPVDSRVTGRGRPVTLATGMAWGLIGGLAGTMVMDLVLMGALSAVGLPALACFSIVGDTVARAFSILGRELAGGAPLGVVTHYLVGPVVGAIFGAAMAQTDFLRVGTRKKCVAFAILYVEILSQPILAMTPLLLRMTTPETVQWFGASFVMHLLFGAVLGLTVSYGRELGTGENHG